MEPRAIKEASATGAASNASEQIVVELQFEGPGQSRLAATTSIAGHIFALHLKQRFNPATRVLALEPSIENLSSADVWRPIRAEVVGFSPRSLSFSGSDNGLTGIGATWDYGQATGPDGKLAPGEMSSFRVVQVGLQAVDEAALHGLKVIMKLTGTTDPAVRPTAAREPGSSEITEGFGAGVLLVKYKGGILDPAALTQFNVKFGLAGQDYSTLLGVYIVFLENSSFDVTRATSELLARDDAVAGVSLAFLARTLALNFPSELELTNSRSLIQLGNWESAWRQDLARGVLPGAGVTVGILDTGIDLDGVEFQGQISTSQDVRVDAEISGLTVPQDLHGHGTAVASIIAAAANGSAVVGGAYGAKLASIKIGTLPAFWPWNVKSGLTFIRDHRNISIVNMSFGYPPTTARLEMVELLGMNDVIKEISAAGTLLVAASGDCAGHDVYWPARLDEVVAVGGTMTDGKSVWQGDFSIICVGSEGSSHGPAVELAAQAIAVPVVNLDNGKTTGDGTSFASPQAAAVAAILKARNQSLTGDQLRRELQQHTIDIGDPGRDEFFGFGRVVAALPSEGSISHKDFPNFCTTDIAHGNITSCVSAFIETSPLTGGGTNLVMGVKNLQGTHPLASRGNPFLLSVVATVVPGTSFQSSTPTAVVVGTRGAVVTLGQPSFLVAPSGFTPASGVEIVGMGIFSDPAHATPSWVLGCDVSAFFSNGSANAFQTCSSIGATGWVTFQAHLTQSFDASQAEAFWSGTYAGGDLNTFIADGLCYTGSPTAFSTGPYLGIHTDCRSQ